MSLGGNVGMYRQYATEKDPDSIEAIRLWDAGVRVSNTNQIQRCWVTNRFGKDGRVMRIVQRGSRRTVRGNELVLSNDGSFSEAAMRLILLDLTLSNSVAAYEKKAGSDPAAAEALRRWNSGCRAVNASLFAENAPKHKPRLVFASSGLPADGLHIVLNSDFPYSEANVRYFLIDIYLGGARDFYLSAAESSHEMACQEAVARYDAGVEVTNLSQFERKRVEGKMVITHKGGTDRIRGSEARLSTD
jgi:hypothetical protein